jgi:putative ubiquitin-RnfH superfamily antitoxin RatB of RatAB toxin-antitoxin module
MKISLVVAEQQSQRWIEKELAEGSTVAQALEASGLLKDLPWFDPEEHRVGIFGRVVKPETELKEGDRIEIYRPITADPETVERRDVD